MRSHTVSYQEYLSRCNLGIMVPIHPLRSDSLRGQLISKVYNKNVFKINVTRKVLVSKVHSRVMRCLCFTCLFIISRSNSHSLTHNSLNERQCDIDV